MPNNYQLWFGKSLDNIKWAEDNLKLNNFPLTCFLSQQAVELSLKGYIYKMEKIPPKTHNLLRLADFCKLEGLKLKESLSDLASLSEYYFEVRYPDMDMENYDKNVAEEALNKARKIVDFVNSKI